MKPAEDYIVPWVKTAEPYSDKHMDVAWEHPQIVRMMSNENLIGPVGRSAGGDPAGCPPGQSVSRVGSRAAQKGWGRLPG